MRCSIRHAFVALPLGLILSGCAAPQKTAPSSRVASRTSVRSTGRPSAPVADRNSPSTATSSTGTIVTDAQHDITLDQIREHVGKGTAVVIDARPADQFARGHVRGSINVPAGQIGAYLPQVEQTVSRDQLIIIYCSGPSCGSGDMVYETLAAQGYSNMRVYSAGWPMLASAKSLQ